MVESRPLEKTLSHVTPIVGIAIVTFPIFIALVASSHEAEDVKASVYFRFPFRMFFFWIIFMTLMLPVEVRILPRRFVKGLIETDE